MNPMTEAPPTLLRAENLTIQFGGLRAVSDFNLELKAGELVGLIGPNGAGKTTVFNMLTGVYKPTQGHVNFYRGKMMRRISELHPHEITQLGVARTFQNIRLFKSMTVLENVAVAQHFRRDYGLFQGIFRLPPFFALEARQRQEILELLKIFQIEKKADMVASSLPYGEQRKLEIVRALATKPQILLLDEPAAGMNPQETRQLMDLISFIRKEFNLTILLIEHDMHLVMGICERLLVLDYGLTIAQGLPAEIQKDPKVIKAYLGDEVIHA